MDFVQHKNQTTSSALPVTQVSKMTNQWWECINSPCVGTGPQLEYSGYPRLPSLTPDEQPLFRWVLLMATVLTTKCVCYYTKLMNRLVDCMLTWTGENKTL